MDYFWYRNIYNLNEVYEKNVITILLLIISVVVASQEENVQIKTLWLNSYKEVLKKEKKTVLIYFKGSDWCGSCKKK